MINTSTSYAPAATHPAVDTESTAASSTAAGNLDPTTTVSSLESEDYLAAQRREQDNLALTPEQVALRVSRLMAKLSKISSESAEAQMEADSAMNKKALEDMNRKIEAAIKKMEKALKKRKFALGMGLGASSLGVLISVAVMAAAIAAIASTGGGAAPAVALALSSMGTLGSVAALAGQAKQASGDKDGWSLGQEFGKLIGSDAGGQLMAGLLTLNFGDVTAASMELDKDKGYSADDKMIASIVVGVVGGLVVAAVGGKAMAGTYKLMEAQKAARVAQQGAQGGAQGAQAADAAGDAQAVADDAIQQAVDRSMEKAMTSIQQLLRRAASSAEYGDAIVGGSLRGVESGYELEAAQAETEAGHRDGDAQEIQAGVEYRFGRMDEAVNAMKNDQQALMTLNATVSEIVSQFHRNLTEIMQPQHAV